MGLRKGGSRCAMPAGIWSLPALLAVAAVAAGIPGTAGRTWLRFERDGIARGEVWRLASGHIVHLGTAHLLLNLAGLALTWLLVGRYYTALQWGVIFVAVMAGIDLGLWFLDRGLEWYVGLSGILHGLLAAGVVAGLRERSAEAPMLGLLLLAKLVWEQFAGPLPGAEATAAGVVVVNAHLYGAVSGAMAAAAIRVRAAGSI